MPAPDTPLVGDELLAAVTDSMVSLHKRYFHRETVVQETRSAFQSAMQDRFIGEVERLSGRRVLAFISNSHVGPDLEIELFVLEAPTTSA